MEKLRSFSRVACLVLAATSCAGGVTIDYIERQDEVVKIITDVYGISPDVVPAIEWIRQYRLNCHPVPRPDTGEVVNNGWVDGYGNCVAGQHRSKSFLSISGVELVQVAVPDGFEWYQLALAHEIGHIREEVLHGDPDESHSTDTFNDPGERGEEDHGLALRARELLRSMGMVQ